MAEKKKKSPGTFSLLGSKVKGFVQGKRDINREKLAQEIHYRVQAQLSDAPEPPVNVSEHVPFSLRLAAAYSWRSLVIAGAIYLGLYLFEKVALIAIPVAVALLLASLLEPLMRFLYLKLGLPRTLSSGVSMIFGLVVIVILFYLATSQIFSEMKDVVYRAQEAVDRVLNWMHTGPLKLETDQVQQLWNQAQGELQRYLGHNAGLLASSAFNGLSTAAVMLTGLLLTLFCLFFFLKDGRTIWQWFLRLMPRNARNPMNEAVIRGWVTIGSYVRAQSIIAFIDAASIAFGAWVIGVPLAVPLGIIVFLASFVPVVGSITSGAVAVAIALVDRGFYTAVIMLVIIIVVQQVEGNLLQPLLMSNAVNLHPLAVVLAVTGGGYVAGIPGAVFAVPLVAFINTTVLYLKGYDNFMRLNYQYDRPGGPPGSLEAELEAAMEPSVENLEEAVREKQRAEAHRERLKKESLQVASRQAQQAVKDSKAQISKDPDK